MTIRLYFDEDSMWQALVTALRARGVDVQTALDTEMIERTDEDHLVFAMTQGRVLCSLNVVYFSRLTLDGTAQSTYWHHSRSPQYRYLSESTCVVCSD